MDFAELHDALGDRTKQDLIRAANPSGRHCYDLMISPKACVGCPKNPLRQGKSQNTDGSRYLEELRSEVIEAVELHSFLKMGIKVDLASLDFTQSRLLLMAQQEICAYERQLIESQTKGKR